MKLSEAIALGSTLIKPLAGTFLSSDQESGCAFGMAVTARNDKATMSSCWELWPWLLTTPKVEFPCRCAQMMRPHPVSIIVHLFNIHVMTEQDWTLDQLIDWVRSVEPAEETPETIASPQSRDTVAA